MNLDGDDYDDEEYGFGGKPTASPMLSEREIAEMRRRRQREEAERRQSADWMRWLIIRR